MKGFYLSLIPHRRVGLPTGHFLSHAYSLDRGGQSFSQVVSLPRLPPRPVPISTLTIIRTTGLLKDSFPTVYCHLVDHLRLNHMQPSSSNKLAIRTRNMSYFSLLCGEVPQLRRGRRIAQGPPRGFQTRYCWKSKYMYECLLATATISRASKIGTQPAA